MILTKIFKFAAGWFWLVEFFSQLLSSFAACFYRRAYSLKKIRTLADFVDLLEEMKQSSFCG